MVGFLFLNDVSSTSLAKSDVLQILAFTFVISEGLTAGLVYVQHF